MALLSGRIRPDLSADPGHELSDGERAGEHFQPQPSCPLLLHRAPEGQEGSLGLLPQAEDHLVRLPQGHEVQHHQPGAEPVVEEQAAMLDGGDCGHPVPFFPELREQQRPQPPIRHDEEEVHTPRIRGIVDGRCGLREDRAGSSSRFRREFGGDPRACVAEIPPHLQRGLPAL